MRALNTCMPYFQGLNSIVAVLLNFFTEEQAYKITKLLVARCEDIQNDCAGYSSFVAALEQQISVKTPEVYRILTSEDLEI